MDLGDKIVDLPLDGAHVDLWVGETRRADDLLGDLARARALILAGCGGNVNDLVDALLKLLKLQRAVIKGRRQPEAVFDERLLARAVAAVHGAHLRQCDVRFVDKHEKVLREIVEQRHGGAPDRAAGDDARIVLHAGTIAQLLDHLDIEIRALRDALGFERLVVVLEKLNALVALAADLLHGARHFLRRRHIVARRVNGRVAERVHRSAREREDLTDALDLVAEVLHADGLIAPVGREDLHRVAAHAEHIALEGDVVSLIPAVDELFQKLLLRQAAAGAERNGHAGKIVRLAETVDAAHGRHNDHVPPFQQRKRRRKAQPVDLLVRGGVLFDVGIRVRDVRFRLVVVVVGNEILHGVVREKLLELAAKLGGERFVVREHERRTLHALDDFRHRVRFAGARDAEQRLLVQPRGHAPGELFDRLRLIARGRIFAYHMKFRHNALLLNNFCNRFIISRHIPAYKRRPGDGQKIRRTACPVDFRPALCYTGSAIRF